MKNIAETLDRILSFLEDNQKEKSEATMSGAIATGPVPLGRGKLLRRIHELYCPICSPYDCSTRDAKLGNGQTVGDNIDNNLSEIGNRRRAVRLSRKK